MHQQTTRLPWERPAGMTRANQSPFRGTEPGAIGRRRRTDDWQAKPSSMKHEFEQYHSEPATLVKVRRGRRLTEYRAKATHHSAPHMIPVTLYGEDIMFLRKACGVDTSEWSKPGETAASVKITLKTKDTRFPRILGAWTPDGGYIERDEWRKQQQAGGAA